MNGRVRVALFSILSIVALMWLPQPAGASATITILNRNEPGIGFNDPAPAQPVGGNAGTTVGEQRLIAFRKAAEIWGALIDSNIEIIVNATFEPLTCTDTSATLGSAGPTEVFSDFPNAEFPHLWYHAALANKLSKARLTEGLAEIRARFNSKLGEPGCLGGRFFYYGLDSNHGTSKVDLVTTLLHEFGHGLGFSTFVDKSTGVPLEKQLDIFSRHIFDNTAGRFWTEMTDSERAASAINTGKVVWDGENVNREAARFLLATPLPLTVLTPAAIAGDLQIGVALFGLQLQPAGITGTLVLARDAPDAPGASTTDACSPIVNAAEVAGKIALFDRGSCDFIVKVKNVQDAGAIAAVVVDLNEGITNFIGVDPTITIPSVKVSLSDGNKLKGQLANNVTILLRSVDIPQRVGTDDRGRVLLFAPDPVVGGSSISHWDTTATPNLLMEPVISSDLKQGVDLTLSQLGDIGWFRSATAPPQVTLTKAASLQFDSDSDGRADPGDIIRYTLIVRNSGGAATAALIQDTVDASTTLVAGSVVSSSGNVTGASPVAVALGDLPAGSQSTVLFDVRVNDATLSSVIQVSNRASVSGANFDRVNSDDPLTTSVDATITRTDFQPIVAQLTAAVAVDSDGSGGLSRGDTIRYTAVIRNSGVTSAANVVFTAAASSNLSLVAGSGTTSMGTVMQLTPDSISVGVGSLAPGAVATVTFQSVVSGTTPSSISSVTLQGSVSSSNFPAIVTDDPATGIRGDATVSYFSLPRRRSVRR